MKEVLHWFAVPALWLTSRTNRQRLGGARVEAVVVLMRKTPQTSVLLVRSVYDKCWMFPQEGVLLKEQLLAAADRGLGEECGLNIIDSNGKLKPKLHVRDVRYVGSLELPKERWGERAVAGNVGDGPMSQDSVEKEGLLGSIRSLGRTGVHSDAQRGRSRHREMVYTQRGGRIDHF